MKHLQACLLLWFCSLTAFAQTPFQVWLQENTHPVDTRVTASQLDPLKTELATARIIGLGEATHATSEFFTFKHHLFRYLVEELGHRVFILEAGFAECEVTNAYIQEGVGSPASAIGATGFWIWNTVEMVDLLKWMRTFNAERDPTDQIRLYGMDMQSTRFPATYLRNFALEFDTDITLAYSPMLKELSQQDFAAMDAETANAYLKKLDRLRGYMQEQQPQYASQMGAQAAARALHHADVLWQAVSTWDGQHNGSWRDQCMADNVNWVLDLQGENSKAVLWAHNGHLIRRENDIGWPLLGTHLARQYGTAYYALGFDFARGNFRAFDNETGVLKIHTIDLPKGKNRYWNDLLTLPGNSSWVNLRATEGNAPVKRFLKRHSSLRSIGGRFIPRRFANTRYYPIQTAFDGLVFMDATTASQPLNSDSRFMIGAVAQTLPWKRRYAGNQIRLEAQVRVQAGEAKTQGILSLRINDRYGYAQGSASQMARSPNWQTVRLEMLAPPKGRQLVVSSMLRRRGQLELDDVKVWVNIKGEWRPIELENGGFQNEASEPWRLSGEGHFEFELPETAGNRYLRIQSKN